MRKVKSVITKAPKEKFVVKKGNIVINQKSKLMIIQDPTALGGVFGKVMTFNEAVKAVAGLNTKGYAGYKNWRLPTVEELCGMVNRNKYNPCYDTNIFKGNFDNWYWSGELCAWNKNSAWCVNSGSGYVSYYTKDSHVYVRPVRSSQCQFDPLKVSKR